MRLTRNLVIVWSLVLGFNSYIASAVDAVVTVRYPADLRTPPTPVHGDQTFSLKAPVGGVVYCTIDTRYLGEHAGGVVDVHSTLHFVVGGFAPDGTRGEARVNGPGVPLVKGRGALLDFTGGWVWVSDQPPSGWSSHTSSGHEPPVTAGALGGSSPVAGRINADEALGWSIITLLRGEWSWAGAIGTEFIYRVASNTGDGNRLEMIYGLDSASKSLLTLADGDEKQIRADGGSFAGVKGRSGIETRLVGRWLGDVSHKAFVKAVRDAVAHVGRD